MAQFSAALEESTRFGAFGLKQVLTKGVAVGGNGITFTIWAFNVSYDNCLVMYPSPPPLSAPRGWPARTTTTPPFLALLRNISSIYYFIN